MSRTLKQQFGLEKDPHAHDHVTTEGGHRLTRIVSRKHGLDSQQYGLPTYHRRIGNPFPLFAFGVGSSLLILGLILVGTRGLMDPQIVLNIALPMGGFGVLTSAMFAFAEGNTFLATSASTLGGLLGGLSLLLLPWTGVKQAYIAEAGGSIIFGIIALYKALGIVYFIAMIPVFLLFIASFKTAVPVSFAALVIVVATILQGYAYINYPSMEIQRAAGGLFILTAISLFYSATSVLLNEEGVKLLPVFPLPRMDEN